MQNQDKLDELFNTFSMLGPLFKRAFNNISSDETEGQIKLAYNQKLCLHIIHMTKEASMSFIANTMGISHQQVTRVVNDLVKLGLVGRKKDQNNKRVILAYETQKGLDLHAKFHNCLKQHFMDYFKKYSDEEIVGAINHIKGLYKIFNVQND